MIRPRMIGGLVVAFALAAGLSGIATTQTLADSAPAPQRRMDREGAEPPRLSTNEAYVQDAMRNTTLAIDDSMAVFAYVLGALADRVKVYPAENYYYFSFIHDHVRYAGNIRLDVLDRDEGKVH